MRRSSALNAGVVVPAFASAHLREGVMAIVTLGIDLAKDVFALRGEDSRR
jgi:hypothetical protein